MVELKLVVDKTFVPALEPGSGNAIRASSASACSTPSSSRRGS